MTPNALIRYIPTSIAMSNHVTAEFQSIAIAARTPMNGTATATMFT